MPDHDPVPTCESLLGLCLVALPVVAWFVRPLLATVFPGWGG